jgi:NitT/TauT family transport system substrate-binding protein
MTLSNNPSLLKSRLALAAALGLAIAVPASAQDTLKIATASTSVAHGPLTMAVVAPEIFGKHNLKIEVSDLRGNSANCIVALISGAADLCQVGTTTGTDAIAEGANLKAVAILTGPINELILSSKAVAKTGVKPDAPLADRIRALKGMRLTTSAPGTAHYTTLMETLKLVGLQPGDIQFRTLGDVPAMIQSIKNDQIDGSLWTIGSLGGLITDGSGVRWISMARGDVTQFKPLPYVTVYARGDWVEKNPGLVDRVNKAYADSIARLKSDPANSSKLIKARYFPDLDQALWDDGFSQAVASYFDGAKGIRKGWQDFLDLQAAATKKNYDAAAFDKAVIPQARAD